MNLEDKFDHFLEKYGDHHAEQMKSLGALGARIDGMNDHLQAVSKKVSEHVGSDEAHGVKAQRHGLSSVIAWIALAGSLLGMFRDHK